MGHSLKPAMAVSEAALTWLRAKFE
jgi:hypothetical protein